jgi:hypothetical protein
VCCLIGAPALGAVTFTTVHGPLYDSLDGQMAQDDYLAGLIATELPGDTGWHPANPASGNPADPHGLPAFTDGLGPLDAVNDVTGLLNDFPGAGNPTKLVEYDLGGPQDLHLIRIFSGNQGRDGRVFSTTVVKYSTDGGFNFSELGYFQSDPSGTINGGQIGSTLVRIFDDGGGAMATGVTHLQFDFYAVDNTGGQMRDPYDGMNPFTSADDGLTAAFVSPLIYEIDAVPEPASLALLALGGLALVRRR